MSSTYSKLIKDATKPKPGAPKAKYIDPIIASTFSQDGSLADCCRALSLRLRETNSLVVFKSLIILHKMIRNGAVDSVLSHLAADQAGLKLRNVSQGGNWQGEKWLEHQLKDGDRSDSWRERYGGGGKEVRYDAPPSLPPYASYLDERIRAFRELKHDVIRSSEGSRSRANGGDGLNRLRKLKVEKGLIREVRISQQVLSKLLDCAFFQDSMSDELNLEAFRMVLKDILALYTGINEGVINILEHYFEMSHTDASKSLDVYKRFCRHTEKVVAYLSSADKAAYSLNMTIPKLKHAPVSLAGALGEYLNDPNFEKNRREYQDNKRVADGLPPSTSSSSVRAEPKPKEDEQQKKKIVFKEPTEAEKTKPPKPPTDNQAIQDFFSTLESEMPSSSSGQFAGSNAFSMAPQATGMAWFGSPNPSYMGDGSYMGGFGGMQPQMTGYNPFLAPGGGGMQPQFTAMQQPFMQPQQTAMPDFMGAQATGFNPFRQSMMAQPTGAMMPPQVTGMGPSGAFDATPFTQQVQQQMAMQRAIKEQQQQQNGQNGNTSNAASPPPQPQQQQQPASPPPKLLPQKTGSRNPFAPPPGERQPTPPPSVPKGPSLAQLAMSGYGTTDGPSQGGGGNYSLGAGAWNGTNPGGSSQQQQQSSSATNSSLVPQKTGLLGSIASEFTSAGRGATNTNDFGVSSPLQSQATAQPLQSPSASSTSPFPSSSLSAGFSSLSFNGSSASPSLQAQPTGYGGSSIKPFKPETDFGTQLHAQATGMPSALQNTAQGTNNPFGMKSSTPSQQSQPQSQQQHPGLNGSAGPFSPSFSSSQTPSTTTSSNFFTPSSIQSQPTGYGASLFGSQQQQQQPQPIASQPTGFPGSSVRPFQPTSAFGTAAFGGNGGGGQQQHQQQNGQQQQQTGNLLSF